MTSCQTGNECAALHVVDNSLGLKQKNNPWGKGGEERLIVDSSRNLDNQAYAYFLTEYPLVYFS